MFRIRMLYWALWATTHWIPAMTADTSVPPFAPATFTETILAPGATPMYLPAELVPSPAMMPAMWVPCP
jgi:hypothetical protein